MDNLNAALQRMVGVGGSASQLVKVMMLGLIFVSLEPRRRKICGTALLLGVGWMLVHGLVSPMASIAWLGTDLVFMVKLVVALFVQQFVAQECLRTNSRAVFIRVLVFAYIVLAINLCLSLFGYGFSQYDDGAGALGYFIAGNEVSGLQLVLTSVLVGLAYQKGGMWYLAMLSLSLVLGALKGTKTGIFGVAIISLATPLVMGDLIRGRVHVARFLGMIVGASALMAGLIYVISAIIVKIGILDRFKYFLGRRGILGALFSDREKRIIPFFQEYMDWDVVRMLFGIGAPDAKLYGYIEIDYLDALRSIGALGLLLVIIMWLGFLAITLRRALNGDRFASQATLLVLFLFVISNMSGHIIYSGLAMPFFGVLVGMFSFAKQDDQVMTYARGKGQ